MKMHNEFTMYNFETVNEAITAGMKKGVNLIQYKEQFSPLWGEIRRAFETGIVYGYIIKGDKRAVDAINSM